MDDVSSSTRTKENRTSNTESWSITVLTSKSNGNLPQTSDIFNHGIQYQLGLLIVHVGPCLAHDPSELGYEVSQASLIDLDQCGLNIEAYSSHPSLFRQPQIMHDLYAVGVDDHI